MFLLARAHQVSSSTQRVKQSLRLHLARRRLCPSPETHSDGPSTPSFSRPLTIGISVSGQGGSTNTSCTSFLGSPPNPQGVCFQNADVQRITKSPSTTGELQTRAVDSANASVFSCKKNKGNRAIWRDPLPDVFLSQKAVGFKQNRSVVDAFGTL